MLGTVAITFAYVSFESLLDNARSLIDIHGRLGKGRGRRHGEMALNRGAVVLAIAAWQTFVEQLARTILEILEAESGRDPKYRLIRAEVLRYIGRFNTPDSRNSVQLLASTGFNPKPYWRFAVRWPIAHLRSGRVQHRLKAYDPEEACDELDAWLQVRHRIAHGGVFDRPMFQALLSGTARGMPSLQRKDAERCVAFIQQLASVTESAAVAEFSSGVGTSSGTEGQASAP